MTYELEIQIEELRAELRNAVDGAGPDPGRARHRPGGTERHDRRAGRPCTSRTAFLRRFPSLVVFEAALLSISFHRHGG